MSQSELESLRLKFERASKQAGVIPWLEVGSHVGRLLEEVAYWKEQYALATGRERLERPEVQGLAE